MLCIGTDAAQGCNDQSIFFTTSVDGGVTWGRPSVAASGAYACWGYGGGVVRRVTWRRPVLHFDAAASTLWLFYSESGPQQNTTAPTGCTRGGSNPGGSVMYTTSTGGIGGACYTLMPNRLRGHVGCAGDHLWVHRPRQHQQDERESAAGDIERLVDPACLGRGAHGVASSSIRWLSAVQVYDLVPDYAAVLISLDRGATWSSHGNITNDKTWLVHAWAW